MQHAVQQLSPIVKMTFGNGQAKQFKDLRIHLAFRQLLRDLVDGMLDVAFLNDIFVGDIAEERELSALLVFHCILGTANQHVGENADVVKDAHGLLARFGLHLANRLDVRH